MPFVANIGSVSSLTRPTRLLIMMVNNGFGYFCLNKHFSGVLFSVVVTGVIRGPRRCAQTTGSRLIC